MPSSSKPATKKTATIASPRARSSKASPPDDGAPPSVRIERRIAELADWRGATLAAMRELIRTADPAIAEEWKWNLPVWTRDGIVCTGETYKAVVKLTFAKGASLEDPAGLFNSSLEGNARRAIDIREGALPDARAFRSLVREAAALNAAGAKAKAEAKTKP